MSISDKKTRTAGIRVVFCLRFMTCGFTLKILETVLLLHPGSGFHILPPELNEAEADTVVDECGDQHC